jgi:hypothetical protein
MTNPSLPRSEREQTDESLRLERDRADRALIMRFPRLMKRPTP